MRKKGFFFTVAALLLLTLLLFAASLSGTSRLMEKTAVIDSRVASVNDFLKSSEQDIQRGVYISGFRAILSAESFISTNGMYLPNAQQNLEELVINGTLNGTSQAFMNGSTLIDWRNSLQQQADKTDILFNITVNQLSFSQEDAWNVLITANITLNVSDKRGAASWLVNKSIQAKVSIIGLEDPMYTVETGGTVIIAVNRTIYEGNYTSGTDVSNLLSHTYGYSFANSTGPSFLMRMQGNFSNSTYGIESLIDISRLQDQGMIIYDRSIVDYAYFSGMNTTNYRINGTPGWFKIDEQHLAKYQVSGLTS